MTTPTLTFTIDRTGMAGSPANLVFSGADGSALGLIDLVEPMLIPRTQYASNAMFLDGGIATASTWDLTSVVATVELEYTSAASLASSLAEVKASLKRIRFPVIVTKNGAAVTYTAQGRGGIALANGSVTRWDLERTTEVYRITIPVNPL